MNLQKLNSLVNNKGLWDSFVEYLSEESQKNTLRIINESNPQEMFVLQGKLRILKELTHLRDKVNGPKDD